MVWYKSCSTSWIKLVKILLAFWYESSHSSIVCDIYVRLSRHNDAKLDNWNLMPFKLASGG